MSTDPSRAKARKDATKALEKIGYTNDQVSQIIRDAHDMFLLERDAA